MSCIWLLVGPPKCIFINSLKNCTKSLNYCAVYCKMQPTVHSAPLHNFKAFHFSLYNRKYTVYHGGYGLYYCPAVWSRARVWKIARMRDTQWKDRTVRDWNSCNSPNTFTIHVLLYTKRVFCWTSSLFAYLRFLSTLLLFHAVNDPRTDVFRCGVVLMKCFMGC